MRPCSWCGCGSCQSGQFMGSALASLGSAADFKSSQSSPLPTASRHVGEVQVGGAHAFGGELAREAAPVKPLERGPRAHAVVTPTAASILV